MSSTSDVGFFLVAVQTGAAALKMLLKSPPQLSLKCKLLLYGGGCAGHQRTTSRCVLELLNCVFDEEVVRPVPIPWRNKVAKKDNHENHSPFVMSQMTQKPGLVTPPLNPRRSLAFLFFSISVQTCGRSQTVRFSFCRKLNLINLSRGLN